MSKVPLSKKPLRVNIWHNIVWSKYKGEVFSSLYKLNKPEEFDLRFFQIAETEGNRMGLSGIDTNHHRYPYKLIFKGSYNDVGFLRRMANIFTHTFAYPADLTLLAGFERPEYWMQMIYLRLKGSKMAVFCDSTINDKRQSPLRGLLKRLFFASVNGFFCYGKRSKEYVVQYGADPQHVFKRCQAAAMPAQYSSDVAMSQRLKLAAKQDAPRYLYVGRLSPEKGLITLLDAFKKVLTTQAKATLIIVGSGPQRAELEAYARQMAMEDAVIFAGSKNGEELAEEYLKATCLLLPSTSEPWGLVVNEALSYGCPVIVSEKCGCIPELIAEGKTGFSHRASDTDDLAQKMIAAPAQFADIAITAYDCLHLISDYSPDNAAKEILAGLRAILSTQYPPHK